MFGWKEKNSTVAAQHNKISGAMNGMLITGQSGFFGDTCVASNLGWRAVDALSVGDMVLTFDHGMQMIVDLQRETLLAPEHMLPSARNPIMVPEGAMNNRKDMWLMPEQGMLVESDAATDVLGDPFAVVPARALKGLRGIRSVAAGDRLDITTLAFAQDEVVYIEGGMLAFCPRPRCIFTEATQGTDGLYDVLDYREARFLAECLINEDNGGALVCDPDEIAGVRAQKARPTRPMPAFA